MQNDNYFFQSLIFIFCMFAAGFLFEKAVTFIIKYKSASFLFCMFVAIIFTVITISGANHVG